MLTGQTILIPTTLTSFYGPWVPRQGNALCWVAQYVNKSGGTISTLTMEVQTKNREDSDSGVSTIGSAATITTTAVGDVTASSVLTGTKELVRYKFNLQASGSTQWVYLIINEPIWLPN